MGSAQSARRIQPGGARPAVPVVPADLSRSPFLPTPPPARRSPLPPRVRRSGGGRGGWCGGGARAGPGVGSEGDRPPAGDRPPPGALPPWRCAATGSGTAGKARWGRWLGGGGASQGAPNHLTPSVTALRPQLSPNPGAEEARYPSPRSPSPPVRLPGGRGGGGRAAPPTARPLSHPPPSPLSGPGGGRGGLSPVRPGRRRAVGSRGDRRSRVSRRSRAHGVGGDVGYPPDPS